MKLPSINLGWPPRECSPNRRPHWRAKARAASTYRRECYFMAVAGGWTKTAGAELAAAAGGRPLLLRLDFLPPNAAARDDDNLIAAFKSGRDGIAAALGIDDRQFSVLSRLLPHDPAALDAAGRRGVVRTSLEVLP